MVSGRSFLDIQRYLDDILLKSYPPLRYFLDPTNSILVISEKNQHAQTFIWVWGMKVVTGSRYLGRLIREAGAQAI